MSTAPHPLLVPPSSRRRPPRTVDPLPAFRIAPSNALAVRLVLLGILLACELTVISFALDTESLRGSTGINGFIFSWGAWCLRAIVIFAVSFPLFEVLRPSSAYCKASLAFPDTPVDCGRFAAHGAVLAWFGVLSAWLFSSSLPPVVADFIAGDWIAFGLIAIVLAATAFVPFATWKAIVLGSGKTWIASLAVAIFACVAGSLGRQLWHPSGKLTFGLVKVLLAPFAHGLIANPATMELGTGRFSVEIAPQCSGFEGAGLMLIFASAWLAFSRRDFRFPQAFVLVPVAVAAAYLLNGVRLAALILIGDAGAPGIALGGFHSQAGWIAFNVLAIGFALGARRIPWVAAPRPIPVAPAAAAQSHRNPVALYLAPFLAILAASMVARAASSGFEWLYPLRFLAALATLWIFRAELKKIDWRCTWLAPAVGAGVFALWIALDGGGSSDAAAGALNSGAPAVRIGWIVIRALAASLTVPIAEELAFRGYLLRRFVSADFENIDPRKITWFALAASSLLFGAVHGNQWLAGSLAGAAYALAYRYRSRIGDAVVAHAVTNALLAAWVISSHGLSVNFN